MKDSNEVLFFRTQHELCAKSVTVISVSFLNGTHDICTEAAIVMSLRPVAKKLSQSRDVVLSLSVIFEPFKIQQHHIGAILKLM